MRAFIGLLYLYMAFVLAVELRYDCDMGIVIYNLKSLHSFFRFGESHSSAHKMGYNEHIIQFLLALLPAEPSYLLVLV